jgi:hypothetical protein
MASLLKKVIPLKKCLIAPWTQLLLAAADSQVFEST